ncbi:hypothetical protein JDV02_008139 [Purpureocillium takamizusanense]|uniref:FAD-binding PCMH-type domain-containing protein n=1 Tax=Purpureocillium takamizusanense TaxID=2060973 RepID=A0A9Q8VEW2_9HYPO|nr:uncharacterized protein JDV02_008139 [Purpureocillium takamizusanense]UNI22232.1 hypothetical protein JDV02_008139 [Purpureocillium takamizusanense]
MHPEQLLLSIPCLLGAASAGRPGTTSSCKAAPGSRAWPSLGEWQALNASAGGRLLSPAPPGAPCHPDQPGYSAEACAAAQRGWRLYDWHAADPVSMMLDQFANYTCLPQERYPCSGQGYPSYVVNATEATHVKAAVDFARKHNVRLVVRSSGHDFLGRSNAPGSLSVWVHHMNGIDFHEGSFKLAGSGRVLGGSAVTVGGGTAMYDIYTATDAYNQTIVGGGAKSVAVGGYISGGGHSTLSPRYGLAADNVIEVEVVTPLGEVLTANEDQHADLFWALRGGGGSTFGVMTKITMWTHPTPKITSLTWMGVTDPKSPFVVDLVSYLSSQIPYLMDKGGLSGYNYASFGTKSPVPLPGIPENIAGVMGLGFVQDKGPGFLEEIFKPINDTVKKRWSGQAFVFLATEEFPTFLAWFDKYFDHNPAGNSSYIVSRLLDGQTLASDPRALGTAIKAAGGSRGGMALFMVGGRGVQNAKPRGGNSVNPAWRNAYVHALSSSSFPPFNKTAERETVKRLDAAMQPLRALTPKSGAYLNEALPFEKDWQHTFWGSNYERLLKIKRTVDPTDVFWCAPCVGNERWAETADGRLCKRK